MNPNISIQNGVLAISSRNNGKFSKIFKSMNMRLLVSMLLVTILPALILQIFYSNYMFSNIRENRINLVRDYCNLFAEEMLDADYLSGTPSTVIDGEIQRFSRLYDGRFVVVNEDYTIRLDTYNMVTGKKLVSEEAVLALAGEERSYYDRESDQVWATYVIKDEADGQIRGMILFFMSCKDLTQTFDILIRTMILVLVSVVALMVILALFMARQFTRPFKALSQSIDRIARGQFDEPVNLTGFSEVEQISDAFNTMMHRLQELESSRQEFVSNVSHELKTPLTSMKVLADSLNMQPDAPVELYREFMQDIGREIDRESTIINDLLSLVKMDKTEAELNVANISLNEMLEMILKRLRPIAAKRNVELVLESYRIVYADCDDVKMTRAITNLVENAIKYNIAGGWVQVTLDSDEKFAYISVADSGIGIAEEYQDKIFERFYRVDKARSRETGGTGLGLSITRQIIQMHKGLIKVSSKEDEGTTFSIRIPLTYVPDEEETK